MIEKYSLVIIIPYRTDRHGGGVNSFFDSIWAEALRLANANDWSINLSTELIGVGLSIPLSFAIALYLDHSSERKRAIRSLQAVLAETHHELKYIVEELPQILQKGENLSNKGRFQYLTLLHATELANRNIKSAIAVARGTFGDRLKERHRRLLTRLDWCWGQIEKLSAMRIPAVQEKLDNLDETVAFMATGYKRYFTYIIEILDELEFKNRKKRDRQTLERSIENIDEIYTPILKIAATYAHQTYSRD